MFFLKKKQNVANLTLYRKNIVFSFEILNYSNNFKKLIKKNGKYFISI